MNITRYAVVGLLFLVALSLLGTITLKVTSLKDLLGSDPYFREVCFEGSAIDHPMGVGKGGVGGLERGDPVLVSGVNVGRVEDVKLDRAEVSDSGSILPGTSRRKSIVLVTLQLRQDVKLYENYSIRIMDSSLLGGKQIVIDPGLGREITEYQVKGALLPSALQSLGEVVNRNTDNINRFFKNMSDISATVSQGDGTVGRLIMDSELHDKLVVIVDRFDRIFTAVEEGPGLFNSLLFDRQIRTDFQSLVRSAKDVAEDLADGRGTMGRLLQEEGMYNDFKQIARDGRKLMEDVKQGKGLLGTLVADELVAERIRDFSVAIVDQDTVMGKLLFDRNLALRIDETLNNLNKIVAHVQSGQGSLGRIVMEEGLVNKIEGLLDTFTGTLTEARESAPVNAFLQTMFKWW